jgi:cytochrome c oxidase subunit IV
MAAGVVAYASSFLGYAVTAARSFAIQIPLFGFAVLFCAGASRWLVAGHGLVGAAWAWGLSLLFELMAAGAILAVLLRRQRTPA